MDKPKAAHRIFDLDVHEISLVDAPAIKRRWVLLLRDTETTMPKPVEIQPEVREALKGVVGTIAKLLGGTLEVQDEDSRKAEAEATKKAEAEAMEAQKKAQAEAEVAQKAKEVESKKAEAEAQKAKDEADQAAKKAEAEAQKAKEDAEQAAKKAAEEAEAKKNDGKTADPDELSDDAEAPQDLIDEMAQMQESTKRLEAALAAAGNDD